MADIFEIAGRIHSTSQEEVVTTTSEILAGDDNKKQSDVNTEVQTALDDRYTKEQTYNKQELDNLITTPDVTYETYRATDETSVDDILPAEGAADTIYRIGNWDGTTEDATKFAEYSWDGSDYVLLRVVDSIGDGVFDISEYNASGGTLAEYDDLADALGTNGANVPEGVRNGGMSVKFVQSSDNNYIQYFLNAQSWTTDTRYWEKINLEDELNQLDQKVSVFNIQTANNTHVPFRLYYGKTYRILNKGANTAYVYFRIGEDSTGQQYAGSIAQGESIDIVAESNFNYIYIYSPSASSYNISIAYIGSLELRVSDLETNSATKENVNTLNSEEQAFASINSLAIGNSANIAFAGCAGQTLWELDNNDSSHVLFIVKPDDVISIVGNSTVGAQYGFLKAYPKPVNGERVQYCSGTSRTTIGINVPSQTTAPSDVKFLCVNKKNNGIDYTPSSVLINGKDPYFDKDIRQHLAEIKAQIKSTNNTLIENVVVTLAGSAASKVVLNEPILLSEDGDEIEFEVTTQAGVNPSLGFANSGLYANGYYSIQLGNSTIGVRAADGTWLYQSVPIRTDGNITMKILYADGNIYTYINGVLKNTYTGQKNIQIASFGNGGNGVYGYWPGTIKNVKVNGVEFKLYAQDIQNAVVVPVFRFLQRSDIENLDFYPCGVLKYDSINKIFDFYSQVGKTNKYYSFHVRLDENNNDLVYLKEWRLSEGKYWSYDGETFTEIGKTIYNAENEMAMYFHGKNDYTGGIHGDERIDVSPDSFVKFFTDGRLITDAEMASDFTVECSSFCYMQLSTLHETTETEGEFVAGHPIVAYHFKRNTFENCASHLENVIKMASEQTVTQYHAGMMCVGKGSGKYAILPGMVVTPELSGNNPPADPASHHSADDFSASRVDLWNPTTGARCYVEGFMVQGFDNETDIDQFEVWDRSTDSKYYRRYVNSTGKVFAANGFIRNIQNVVYY